jgi:hypothetical protein
VATTEPSRSLLWPAVLVGIGVAGSLDEIVLHQLLRWHHFYDRGSQAAGLIADGIFHLGSTAFTGQRFAPPGPPERPGEYDTPQLHAMASGLSRPSNSRRLQQAATHISGAKATSAKYRYSSLP